MAEGRTGSSGYVVKTGGGGNPYLKTNSGLVEKNPGGNANSQIPSYSSPSLRYGPTKDNLVGGIVKPAG
jgi:hypothetical protein